MGSDYIMLQLLGYYQILGKSVLCKLYEE